MAEQVTSFRYTGVSAKAVLPPLTSLFSQPKFWPKQSGKMQKGLFVKDTEIKLSQCADNTA